jgi:hypothetical protein
MPIVREGDTAKAVVIAPSDSVLKRKVGDLSIGFISVELKVPCALARSL